MPELQIPTEKILEFLKAIEEGKITLIAQVDPQYVYAGNVIYNASNEWQIVVFNDCNEWDYIDEITTNEGAKVDYDELEQIPDLCEYDPGDELAWKRYGIPGHTKFRCTECDSEMLNFRDLEQHRTSC